ncbi:hypothetical protein [Galbibacter sp.]|nr:hypothetical protein [Galbibacter sp.]HLV62670.1 hypothetical protein [Galbibacter sp.]
MTKKRKEAKEKKAWICGKLLRVYHNPTPLQQRMTLNSIKI